MFKSRPVFLLALILAPVACLGPGDEVQLDPPGDAVTAPLHASRNLSAAQRFGKEPIGRAEADPLTDPRSTFLYDLPQGWTELEPAGMRMVNLQPAGQADAECYLSMLGGDGGGLAANLNRWRDQMGLDPLTETEVDALPTVELIGGRAHLVDLRGDFTGMGGDPMTGWGMLGAVLSTPQVTLFVKMTGPANLVDTERDAFLGFVASLSFGIPEEAEVPGHDHDHGAAGPEDDAQGGAADPAPSTEPTPIVSNYGFRGMMPAGWKDAGPRTMVAINMEVSPDTECYLSILGGDGGGLVRNINRWQDQLGLAPLSEEEVENLPRIEMCGGSAYLLVAHGEFQGMSGEARDGITMLGAALMRENDALFLKMIGPQAEVSQHEEDFLAFAASLEEVQ